MEQRLQLTPPAPKYSLNASPGLWRCDAAIASGPEGCPRARVYDGNGAVVYECWHVGCDDGLPVQRRNERTMANVRLLSAAPTLVRHAYAVMVPYLREIRSTVREGRTAELALKLPAIRTALDEAKEMLGRIDQHYSPSPWRTEGQVRQVGYRNKRHTISVFERNEIVAVCPLIEAPGLSPQQRIARTRANACMAAVIPEVHQHMDTELWTSLHALRSALEFERSGYPSVESYVGSGRLDQVIASADALFARVQGVGVEQREQVQDFPTESETNETEATRL